MVKDNLFTSYLKKDGLKITNQRINILKCIKLFKNHFNAEDVYEYLKKNLKEVSRASIYRMLPLLKKDGIIKEVGRDENDKIIYECVENVPHHDHIVCIKCGKIIEFKNEKIEKLQNDICMQYKFKLLEHNMELKGICKECLKREKKNDIN